MPHHSNTGDYSRYFVLKQKIYLVNMSAERNSEIYESLSGFVTSSNRDSLEIMITHSGFGSLGSGLENKTYKLTSESMGSGIQVLADLIGATAGNIFKFRMHGTLEMFQRRSVPRLELTTKLYQMCENASLAFFKNEWKRVTDHLRLNGALPDFTLRETLIDLNAGGIGLTTDTAKRPTQISMFLIALNEGVTVCALAETVWEKPEEVGLRCGFRFIHILKTDQERINSHLNKLARESGGTHPDFKRNWVLVDKMVTEVGKIK